MALQNTSSTGSHSFDKNLVKDVNDFHLSPQSWIHARNAINNSKTGDLGKIGNEPANDPCAFNSLTGLSLIPYQIIGVIYLEKDKWAIFSTNGTNSEIGLFLEETCEYFTVVNADCLNFNAEHLIIGASRPTSDCYFEIYWADGNNPDRFLVFDVDNPLNNLYTSPNSPLPWIQNCNTVNGCQICVNTPVLDCDKIRLAKLITPPCIEITKGASGGTLLNGSYMIFAAYSIRGQKISDYYMSNVQSLFDHDNSSGAIDVLINSADTRFDEMIIIIVSMINQQTVARQAGLYSTHQKRLSFDIINDNWPAVPIEQLPLMTPIYEKSDGVFNVGQYLIRVGPTSKIDFNYQPYANQILTKWVSVEYDAKYYREGGNNTGYLRDEVYSFFIRWVYDTGDKSASYHIPGRPATTQDLAITLADYVPSVDGPTAERWRSENTAVQLNAAVITQPDGGVQIAEGLMGYWESSEIYPDDKPQVWNAAGPGVYGAQLPSLTLGGTLLQFNSILPTAYDLCGNPIRHHKFPEDCLSPQTKLFNSTTGDKIRIMGVKFENIPRPVYSNGQPVPGIIGYEILRGSRNGNKTILAKGLINNMGQYIIQDGTTSRTGLYPNYPYNDVSPDPFLSTGQTSRGFSMFGALNNENGYSPVSTFSRDNFTFHSPDTNFNRIYLDAKELKVYGNVWGPVNGKFEYSEKHPKEKLMTNLSLFISNIIGIGIATLALGGKRTTRYVPPYSQGFSQDDYVNLATATNTNSAGGPLPVPVTTIGGSVQAPLGPPLPVAPSTIHYPFMTVQAPAALAGQTGYESALSLGGALTLLLAGDHPLGPIDSTSLTGFGGFTAAHITNWTTSLGSLSSPLREFTQEAALSANIPGPTRLFSALPSFYNYWVQGSDSFFELLRAIVPFSNYVLRYQSHGFYNNFDKSQPGDRRRAIQDSQYIGPQNTDFTPAYRINNMYRASTVALQVAGTISYTTTDDRTRYKVTDVNSNAFPDFYKEPTKGSLGPSTSYIANCPSGNQGHQICSSHYVALKQRLVNQYGQLTNIHQILASECMTPVPDWTQPGTKASTGIVFGGDTYIGRYTEKNTFFYFYDWLYEQPNGEQFDYNQHKMFAGLFPRFWANFDKFETTDFTSSVLSNILNPGNWQTPSDYYNLDALAGFNIGTVRLSVRHSWMYLFNSGVKDFFVESEINIDLRDWGNRDSEKHYDPYRDTDVKALFNTNIIKAGNYYKYDQSLSISKLFLNYISWANTQLRDYDPYLAETCYDYNPNKVIYSLPVQFEGRRDNWLIYLANNYFNFINKPTSIKAINKNGAIILFENAAPVEFQGTDQLQTSLGTKLTIGDGGLFSQPMQAITNADGAYEYGSCQDRLSIINTPGGIFWVSQSSGKIFQMAGGLKEISNSDLKWWFTNYLPYKLSQLFPDYELKDNPVIGIGCQAVYDNENGLVYFTKKDYVLKAPFTKGQFTYNGSNNFTYLPTGLPIKLGDPIYFEDASWTVSYDVKIGEWLGWHDWHPELLIPGKNTFMSIVTDPVSKRGGIWRHNERCDLYCNYYGKDYPFEIEYMINTPQQVNTLRSVEYYMEVYKYNQNCYDRFHVLDYNFDEAVIYNTEQCSGMLRMNLTPKNNPQLELQYPSVPPLNPTYMDILFSKEENKYRFNQFWDITDDRGEFNPAAQRVIWNTQANGYIKSLNAFNLNYNKPPFERKKFRHYTNSVFLRKRVIAGQQMRYKMLVMIANNKQLNSPR